MNSFQKLAIAKREKGLKKMAEFLTAFADDYQQLRLQKPADFNLFSLLRIEDDEVKHSAFLAWLIDTKSAHKEGNLFLKTFVQSCHLDIPLNLLEHYRVRSEFSGFESIIDILVYRRGEFLIYIENKVLSQEGLNQVDREFRDLQRLGSTLSIRKNRQFAIFLTPDGRKPISGDPTPWRSVSYGEIRTAFKDLLPKIKFDKVKFILEDWLVATSGFGNTNGNIF